MYETTYHRAGSVSEAADLLTKADDGKFLGGGQTLLPTMKQRLAAPTDLVDLTRIAEMKGISEAGGKLTIGSATCRGRRWKTQPPHGWLPRQW